MFWQPNAHTHITFTCTRYEYVHIHTYRYVYMCPDTSPEPHAHIHAHTQHTHTTHEDEDKKIVETVVKTKKNKKGEDFKMEWNCVHSRITHITRTLIHKTYIAHHPRPNLIYVGAFAHACASTSTHHIYIYIYIYMHLRIYTKMVAKYKGKDTMWKWKASKACTYGKSLFSQVSLWFGGGVGHTHIRKLQHTTTHSGKFTCFMCCVCYENFTVKVIDISR